MKSTFYLKQPNSDKETLILFSAYFKFEERKFVYSTGEKILPIHWDAKNRQPFSRGKKKSPKATAIQLQLDRYKKTFQQIQTRCQTFEEDFTTVILKEAFDNEFKKAPSGKGIFFKAFDEFVDFKTKEMAWSPSTIKRYTNIKNILQGFEENKKYKLTFNSITSKFSVEFSDYCVNSLKHAHNTYARNIGLFKTFMHWALREKYTYKEDYKQIRIAERIVTEQIALKMVDIENILKLEFETERLEKARDIFVFSCLTGMRFGELKLISRENVVDRNVQLKEEKGKKKRVRNIPLHELAMYLLKKYNYKLPLIANQKQNDYIKEIFELAGYTQMTEKITTRGNKDIREKIPFYERVSTHTARRTFITMMKKERLSDKLIASITGHKDMKTLNKYYQVDDEEKTMAVDETFKIDFAPLKKVD